jgi:hypothetical protein
MCPVSSLLFVDVIPGPWQMVVAKNGKVSNYALSKGNYPSLTDNQRKRTAQDAA